MYEHRKFYSKVPLAPKQDEPVERERGHQRLNPDRLTGRFHFDLVAWQRLHVGSGMLVPPEKLGLAGDAPLVKAFFRIEETLTIPGSSLKGVVRSLVELFTYSCVSKTRERWRGREQQDYRECLYKSRWRKGDLCPACKLFGAMGYQGQVRFDDAPQTEGHHEIHPIPPQYQPRRDRRNRRYYPYDLSDDRERTWPLEVATTTSRFAVRAQFTNLTEAELGVLLIALGQGTWNLCPRVGAGKSSGLGGACVENLVAEEWQVRQAYQAFDGETWKSVDLETCLQAAQPLLRTGVLGQLADDLGIQQAKGT